MSEPNVVTITTYDQARDAYRQKQLRQALYDAGDVVMADVLVNLHGDEHRARRRLENRLFRRETHARYERELFPPIVEETLAPHVAAGHAELVGLSHQMMMNLAAFSSGVDRPDGSPEETLHLYSYMMRFIEGATLAHYTGDRDAKRAEVAEALTAFDAEFLQPSIARRRTALARFDAGEIGEEDLPRDVLTVLLRNQDDLELADDVVLRETCFYLLAGAHTSATAFVRTLHSVFEMTTSSPADAERARHDLDFLQTLRARDRAPPAVQPGRHAMGPRRGGPRRRATRGAGRQGGHRSDGGRTVTRPRSVNEPNVSTPMVELPDRRGPVGPQLRAGHARLHRPGTGRGHRQPGGADRERSISTASSPSPPERCSPLARRPIPPDRRSSDPESARGYWGRYPVVFRT